MISVVGLYAKRFTDERHDIFSWDWKKQKWAVMVPANTPLYLWVNVVLVVVIVSLFISHTHTSIACFIHYSIIHTYIHPSIHPKYCRPCDWGNLISIYFTLFTTNHYPILLLDSVFHLNLYISLSLFSDGIIWRKTLTPTSSSIKEPSATPSSSPSSSLPLYMLAPLITE